MCVRYSTVCVKTRPLKLLSISSWSSEGAQEAGSHGASEAGNGGEKRERNYFH